MVGSTRRSAARVVRRLQAALDRRLGPASPVGAELEAQVADLVGHVGALQAQVGRLEGEVLAAATAAAGGAARAAQRWPLTPAAWPDDSPALLDRMVVEEVVVDVGTMVLPAYDQVVLPALRASGRWEPEEGELLRGLLRPGMVAVDVGAHCGYHALLMAGAVGSTGRVIAFEPEVRNHACLVANAARNPGNITCLWAAAGARAGTVDLLVNEVNSGDHRLHRHGQDDTILTSIQVPLVTLDEALGETAVDLLLIDTQGHDHQVLEGARRLLGRCRPKVLVEFWPEGIRWAEADPAKVVAEYRELGYDVAVLERPDLPPRCEPAAIVEAAVANRGGYVSLVLTPMA